MSDAVRQAVLAQYAAHKSWSVQLHHDNLVALAETQPRAQAGAVLRHAAPVHERQRPRQAAAPHAAPNRRRRARRGPHRRSRGARLRGRVCQRPVALGLPPRLAQGAHRSAASGRPRSCSACSTIARGSPVTCNGIWPRPPRSSRTGLSQAFQKRGLPRAALSDNGAAMTAAEITEGLTRLGILHQTTLPYSPYQNAKQEAFWGPVEGRLIAMLEDVPDLTLALPQRGDAGLGRARVQPQGPLRDRRGAARALPRRPERDAALPRQRRAAPRLHAHRRSAPRRRATAPSSSRAAASRCPTAIGISPASRSATRAGTSASSTSSTSAPATCSRASIRRTRRTTPAACAGRSIRVSPRSRPSRAAGAGIAAAARAAARPAGRHRPAAGLSAQGRTTATTKETTHEQEDAGALRPQVEPVRPRRAGRGAARQPAHRVVLLARRAARRRRRLRPRHRRARHRQVRHPAHPRRAARRATRRQDRHPQPAPGRPRRLLSRDGRPVRRRARARTTAGPAPRCCASAGRPISMPRCRGPC